MVNSINDLKRHASMLIPLIEQTISRVVASGWFVLGPEVTAFEEEFASYCSLQNCVTVANGTDAIELSLRALDISEGKTVLTVANAGMYSSIAIFATGAMPLYADVCADTMLIDVKDVSRILANHKVDAIIVTHLYGLLANVEDIMAIAKKYGVPVIEDCAQAHGASRLGKRAGSFGDMACFSFYPTKNLGALGDGGAIVTSRKELADKVKSFRQYGWSSKYNLTLPGGRNSRLDEMQAAILRVKLPLLDQWNNQRRNIAERYSKGINNVKVITPKVYGEEYVAHLYVIRTDSRDELRQYLTESGVPSDVHYPIPDYAQPAYCQHFSGKSFPVTKRVCSEVLTLPCFPEMTDDEVDAVIDCVNSW